MNEKTEADPSISDLNQVTELFNKLRSEDLKEKIYAVEKISRLGSQVSTQVQSLLQDLDTNVVKLAVEILKNMDAPFVDDILIQALFHEDANVSVAVAESLGIRRSRKAVPYLVQCLTKDPWVKSAALKSLGDIGDENALDAILDLDVDEDPVVLFCAVQAIGKIKNPKGIDFLLRLLKNNTKSLVPYIIQACASLIENANESLVTTIKNNIPEKSLESFLASNNKTVLKQVIFLMGCFKEKSLVKHINDLYNEANEPLFETIENALLKIQPKNLSPFLSILENPNHSSSIKTNVILLLGKLKIKDTPAHLYKFLYHQDEDIRLAAIAAIKNIHDPASIESLYNMHNDDSFEVRMEAACAIAQFDLELIQSKIESLLEDKDEQKLLFGLEMIPNTETIVLKDAILKACDNKNEDIVKKALSKAAYLKTNDSFQIVSDHLKSNSNSIRRQAIRALEHHNAFDIDPYLINSAQKDEDEWNRYEAIQVIKRLKRFDLVSILSKDMEKMSEMIRAALFETAANSKDQM